MYVCCVANARPSCSGFPLNMNGFGFVLVSLKDHILELVPRPHINLTVNLSRIPPDGMRGFPEFPAINNRGFPR
ncbi:hypothetical protein MT325_m825L [Paramecium bursaria chlorella virus MT325]|uniref:Uncharacterized protein m825L n=1 Tax=Paramecium bursaria Chlorella virus MT325 TaxID=346932 RepID=A7IVK5_PBCVM|nr:hypothetical protein MT325_m825L [Paramecium bursaria chlorella virus MT325]